MRTSPGLFDLQVNGYAGVDFNDPDITPSRLDEALAAMRLSGVTQCLPTLITAEADALKERFRALDAAVAGSRLGAAMVPGYHLEGPFLNPEPGFAGCHPAQAMTDPSMVLLDELEGLVDRPILLVTLAPERAGAPAFIRALTARGKVAAVAHSAAGFADIAAGIEAGLTLSTHLGNGLPQQLPKLENPLLAQLGEPRLTACLIADGHHLSPGALGAMVRIKRPQNCILVTDAVLGAAASPGHYVFAGMAVERTEAGAMVQPGQPNLAGSALCLDQAVRNIVDWSIASAETAIAMAAQHPRMAMEKALVSHGLRLDAGIVHWDDQAHANHRRGLGQGDDPQARQDRWIIKTASGRAIGDQHIDVGYLRHHVRRAASEFFIVGHEDDLPRTGQDRAHQIDLHRVKFLHRALAVDSAGADDGDIELEPLAAVIGKGQDRGILVAHIAAVNIDSGVGLERAGMGHFKIRRGDENARMTGQHFVQGIKGCAQSDENGAAGCQKLFERRHQLALDPDLHGVALMMGMMGDAGRRKGAAKTLLQKTLGFQRAQITANGLVGDIEPLGQFGDRRCPMGPHRLKNGLSTLADPAIGRWCIHRNFCRLGAQLWGGHSTHLRRTPR
ncbi:hypothetical protein PSQ19_00175 [Devosia algicola]|uniref:N-acetylglucosamine-6-phosphate deacetylase n=1 Tax=Devosia algicola TaxID=3026418 RepID=A0ABY7YP81_9HYPH|nr:hypothetical protein [Devosia algicola]WDR02700.1 hypothetical protein PSQ19_00175 [Devosia algicola]